MLYLFAKLGHFLGIILGVGGAVYSDFLLLQFIKHRKIEGTSLKYWKQLIYPVWAGLVLLLISGLIYFYVQNLDNGEILYFDSQPFWAKITIFIVLVINFIYFHFKFIKKLGYSVDENFRLFKNNVFYLNFANSISIVSWIYLLFLGTFRTITPKYFSYFEVLGMYVGLIIIFFILIHKKYK